MFVSASLSLNCLPRGCVFIMRSLLPLNEFYRNTVFQFSAWALLRGAVRAADSCWCLSILLIMNSGEKWERTAESERIVLSSSYSMNILLLSRSQKIYKATIFWVWKHNLWFWICKSEFKFYSIHRELWKYVEINAKSKSYRIPHLRL